MSAAPSATVEKNSFLRDSLLVATKEVRESLYGVRGSMWAVLSAIVLSLMSYLLLTDKELLLLDQTEIALAGLGALAIGFASSEIVKELTMRPRPFAVLPDARLLVPEPSSLALPSGHTTSAFAAASSALLAARRLLKRVPPWGWGMLTLAAAISYSRVYVGVHWPTDVAEGVVLGLASGWVGVRLALRGGRKHPKPSPGRTEEPYKAPQVQYVFLRGDER